MKRRAFKFDHGPEDDVMALVQERLERTLFLWDSDSEVHLPDFFHPPPADLNWDVLAGTTGAEELPRLSRDSSGNQRALTGEQLQELRQTGAFGVHSELMDGARHVWEVSNLLQEGSEKSLACLYTSLSVALEWVIVTMPELLVGARGPSVRAGLRFLVDGMTDFPRHVLGFREMSCAHAPHEIDGIIGASARKFIQSGRGITLSPLHVEGTPPNDWRVPPSAGFHIDLRLVAPDLRDNLSTILADLDAKNQREWVGMFVQFCQQCLDEGATREAAVHLYADAVHHSLVVACRHSKELEDLSPGLGESVAHALTARRCVAKVRGECRARSLEHRTSVEESLKCDYPVRSKVSSWLKKQVGDAMDAYNAEHEGEEDRKVVDALRGSECLQEAYIAEGYMIYRAEHEEQQRRQLEASVVPSHTFTWYRRIWSPTNWIITKHQDGRNVWYSVNKYTELSTDTRYPLWRLSNIYQRTVRNFVNGTYRLFVGLMYSPSGLCALCMPNKFYPAVRVSHTTGELETDDSFGVETLMGRIRALWGHVRQSREAFESAPDNGFLGKGITRAFNVVWNYVVKGMIGSMLVLVVQPVLTLITTLVCAPLLLTSPVWAPALAVVQYLISVGVYDTLLGVPFPLVGSLLWIVGGVVQMFVSAGLCAASPVIALVHTATAALRYTTRRVYDSTLYWGLLQFRARVPEEDGFFVRRVAGPGISETVYHTLSPREALAAVAMHCERLAMRTFESTCLHMINEPVRTLHSSLESVCAPIGVVPTPMPAVFRAILKSTAMHADILKAKARSWRDEQGSTRPRRYGLRQSSACLDVTERIVARYLEEFVPQHLLTSLDAPKVTQWWDTQRLAVDDWPGLARTMLVEVFGAEFVESYEESDKHVILTINHVGLSEFGNMVMDAVPRDDLDEVRPPSRVLRSLSARLPPESAMDILRNPEECVTAWWHPVLQQRRRASDSFL